MFFRSVRALPLAVLLIGVGGFGASQGPHNRGVSPGEKVQPSVPSSTLFTAEIPITNIGFRGKIFFGTFTLACGLLLLGLYSRLPASPDEWKEADVDRPDNGPKLFMSFPKNHLVSNRPLTRLPRGKRG
jgi:hypothetical protein